MSTGRQTMNWNAQVHDDILVAIFSVAKLSSTQMAAVMAQLAEKGYTFTESALR